MDYYLPIEDLDRLAAGVEERTIAEGVPTRDEEGCGLPAAGVFLDGRLLCTRHAEERADVLAANDVR